MPCPKFVCWVNTRALSSMDLNFWVPFVIKETLRFPQVPSYVALFDFSYRGHVWPFLLTTWLLVLPSSSYQSSFNILSLWFVDQEFVSYLPLQTHKFSSCCVLQVEALDFIELCIVRSCHLLVSINHWSSWWHFPPFSSSSLSILLLFVYIPLFNPSLVYQEVKCKLVELQHLLLYPSAFPFLSLP